MWPTVVISLLTTLALVIETIILSRQLLMKGIRVKT
jgi:heme exporter protein D